MKWIIHVNFNTKLCFRFSQIINSSKTLLNKIITDLQDFSLNGNVFTYNPTDIYDGMDLAQQYHCLSLLSNFPRKPYLKTNNKVSQTVSINRNQQRAYQKQNTASNHEFPLSFRNRFIFHVINDIHSVYLRNMIHFHYDGVLPVQCINCSCAHC